jgi:hypothetical protein
VPAPAAPVSDGRTLANAGLRVAGPSKSRPASGGQRSGGLPEGEDEGSRRRSPIEVQRDRQEDHEDPDAPKDCLP